MKHSKSIKKIDTALTKIKESFFGRQVFGEWEPLNETESKRKALKKKRTIEASLPYDVCFYHWYIKVCCTFREF